MSYMKEDIRLSLTADIDERDNTHKAVEKKPCPICGSGSLIVDTSMALIQCDGCGISFEYRYRRGVIPYTTILKARKQTSEFGRLKEHCYNILTELKFIEKGLANINEININNFNKAEVYELDCEKVEAHVLLKNVIEQMESWK